MITCKGGRDIPCVMKLAHYLRYYESQHATKLSPERRTKRRLRKGSF